MQILMAFLIMTAANTLHTQNHYWLQQYGEENTLLGGEVVTSISVSRHR
jgi:hypothetical protein